MLSPRAECFSGVANKTLEKFADKVFLGFPEASHYFHQPEKHIVVGNPVRRRFYDIDKIAARENWESRRMILLYFLLAEAKVQKNQRSSF